MKTFHLTFKSILAICYLCFSVDIQAQLSGNYTLDANSAASSTNFQSFADFTTALDTQGVSGAVNLNVVTNSGPYQERVVFKPYQGVTAQNNITINGNGEKVIFYPGSVDYRIIGIDSNVKHLTIDSLYIESLGGTNTIGIHMLPKVDSIRILNCTLDMRKVDMSYHHRSVGIALCGTRSALTEGSGSNIEIIKNLIFGSDSGAVFCGISLNAEASSSFNNKIIGNKIIDFQNIGIYINNQENLLIANNEISSPSENIPRPGGSPSVGIRLEVDATILNSIIKNNKIYNIARGGFAAFSGSRIFATASKPNHFVNNLIYKLSNSNDSTTTSSSGIVCSNCRYFNFYHNTVSLDRKQEGDNRISANGGIGITGSFYNVKNNLISILDNSPNRKIGITLMQSGTILNTFNDYNNVFVYSLHPRSVDFYGEFNNYDQNLLSDWKSVNTSPNAQNSLNLDPMFRAIDDPTPYEVALADAGTYVGINEDFYGNPRDSTPSIGAIEFDSTVLTTFNYPYYPISVINSKDSVFGLPDSIGVRCYTSGTVYGIDINSDESIRYFIFDHSSGLQEGIRIYNWDTIPNSSLNEGDSIKVLGIVSHKNGNLEMYANRIEILKSGALLPQAIATDTIGEAYENKMVVMRDFSLSGRFNHTSHRFKMTKNGKETEVYVPDNSGISDSIIFNAEWFLGDTICSVEGVVMQTTDFNNKYVLVPMYSKAIDYTTCDITTSLEEHKQSNFKLYPNPSNGNVTLKGEGYMGNEISIEVTDLSGKTVFQSVIKPRQKSLVTNLDLKHLSKGVYVIKLLDSTTFYSQKVVIL